jgi:hypothetical protein
MRICLHGLTVAIRCRVPSLQGLCSLMFRDLQVDDLPPGFQPFEGDVLPYDGDAVTRSISPNARPVTGDEEPASIYADGERLWLIDETWGLCEINLLKRHWKAWVIDRPSIDAIPLFEAAILWPMAQLLRHQGLHLIPAASLAVGNRGVLLLASFDLEPELRAAIDAGFDLVGQRWTALREEDGQIALLQLPGRVERIPSPTLRGGVRVDARPTWVDLAAERPNAQRLHAFCDSVLIIEPGRRSQQQVMPLQAGSAAAALKTAWPIPDAGPGRGSAGLIGTLALTAQATRVVLSRDVRSTVTLLRSATLTDSSAESVFGLPSPTVETTIYVPARREPLPESLAG